MSQPGDANAELPFFNLVYCVWLPAGKDEFGFENFDEAPLSPTALYRYETLEGTIASHFEDMVRRLRSDNSLAFMDTSGSLAPRDGELGLRKIHFNFSYRSGFDFGGILRTGPIEGSAVFLSNGTYIWSFRMPVAQTIDGEPSARIKDAFQDFLKHDFVPRHIAHLFDFGWNPNQTQEARGGKALKENRQPYQGILTYYQLDLLCNGVFDQSAHPHLSLGEQTPEGKPRADNARRHYDIEYLIKSFSLCVVGTEYLPLFDRRKTYTLRRTHGAANAHVDTTLSLSEFVLPKDQDDELHLREIFLSRLSFAAMEQFLRVAISFGLLYYKTGLDHVRAELISQGMERRKNRVSGELRRESLDQRSLTLADMEAYYALLAGKVPVLQFLRDLIKGMGEVSRPTIDPDAILDAVERVADTDQRVVPEGQSGGRRRVDARGAIEWKFSEDTLAEAQTQFGRQVDAITADLAAIQSSLDAVRSELMLLELTETRKLSEIAAETPRAELDGEVITAKGSFTIDPGLERRVTLILTALAIGLAIIQLFTDVGLTLSQAAFADGVDIHDGSQRFVGGYWVSLALLVLLGLWIGKRRLFDVPSAEASQPTPSKGAKLETHVFDYSSLSHRIEGSSAELMLAIQSAMVDIEDPAKPRQPVAGSSTFHEVPSGGIERIKYSLESQPSKSQLTYVLHVEFDRRLNLDRAERLLDLRLVVRRPVTSPDVDVVRNSRHVIGEAIARLLPDDMNNTDMRDYTRQHFGWEWPMTPETGAAPRQPLLDEA